MEDTLYLDYAESAVRGADLTLSLSDIAGWKSASLQLEGSYVNRYENLKDNADYVDRLTTNNLDMYAVGGNFNWNGLDVRAEYVTKTKDLPEISSATEVDGNAILAEVGYATGNFSALGTFRRLEHMNTMLTLQGQGAGNTLNYLPALTRQYTYMLANLEPYQVNAEGETAGQFDVYYSLRPAQTVLVIGISMQISRQLIRIKILQENLVCYGVTSMLM